MNSFSMSVPLSLCAKRILFRFFLLVVAKVAWIVVAEIILLLVDHIGRWIHIIIICRRRRCCCCCLHRDISSSSHLVRGR